MSSTKMPGMKKIFSFNAFKSKSGNSTRDAPAQSVHNAVESATADDTPEARIRSAMLGFCHAGGPTNSGDEVAFLPTIVEMADASPAAAREAARVIRKQISVANSNRPSVQYNGIMLLRILSDNPGARFTKNLDASKFLASIKMLWKEGRDPSVRQIFWETMDYLEENKSGLQGLTEIIEWWKYEKLQATQPPIAQKKSFTGGLSRFNTTKGNKQAKARVAVNPIQSPIPPVDQLVSRISEAQASAKLLHQVISNTPKREVGKSELIKEFAIRCKNASKSIHSYITADADIEENLLTTLIETHELLSVALTRYNGLMEAYELNKALERSNGGKHRAHTPPPIDQHLDEDGFPVIVPPSESSRTSQPQHTGLGYSSFPVTNDRDMLDPYEYGKNPFADDNGEGSSGAYAYDDDDEVRPKVDKGKGKAIDSDSIRDLSPIDTSGANGSSRPRADTVDSVVSPVTPRADYDSPITTGVIPTSTLSRPPPPPAPITSHTSSLAHPPQPPPPPPPPVPKKQAELPYPLD